MTKEVILSISGLQMDDNDNDNVEVINIGDYYFKNGKHYVKFQERSEESGNEVTSSLLRFTEERVDLKRTGFTSVNFQFETGMKNVTCYHTPYGDLTVGFASKQVDVKVLEDIIELYINYNLEINGEKTGEREIRIKIQPRNEKYHGLSN